MKNFKIPKIQALILFVAVTLALYLFFFRSSGVSVVPSQVIYVKSRVKVPELLPSGFDDNASWIYRYWCSRDWELVLEGNVVNVSMPPLSWRAVSNQFWEHVNSRTWELETYKHFNQFLNRGTTLVDFGTWIGPTILYGAQIAGRTLGIEADPAAFAEANINLNLNTDKIKNAIIQPACVSTLEGVQGMHSAGAGNSCSGLGKVACGEVTQSWSVQCYHLQTLFKKWDIDLGMNTFIKIDIESHECELLPHLKEWLLTVQTKPTLHVAMHGQIRSCSPSQYHQINQLIWQYRFGFCKEVIKSIGDYEVQQFCSSDNLVLSDFLQPV